MPGVEVLAPLRIETRFAPPDPTGGRLQWLLRLRVYPDEFSMERRPPPPTPEELDRLDEALAAPLRAPPVDSAAAFSALAAAVGAPRAVWLMRTVPVIEVDDMPTADRAGQQPRTADAWPISHLPAGLPPELDVWLIPAAGPRTLAATLTVDRDAVAADLDLEGFSDEASIRAGELPRTWWTSFERAQEVGLGIEIALGPTTPNFEAILVVGLGDSDPTKLLAAHAASGRLAILPPGTATNTVEGEATTELGRDPAAWLPLVSADPAGQPAAAAAMRVLTGKPAAFPLLGGDVDPQGPAPALVVALWPALWGRSMRDVMGAAKTEAAIARWSGDHLAPEGPYPAIRVGDQPYGLLPATALGRWAPDATDPEAEENVRGWAVAWRDLAVQAAEAAGTAVGASTERLLELLGESTPSRRWGVRPVAPLAVTRAQRAAAGLPTISATLWEDMTSNVLAGRPHPWRPLAPIDALFDLPGDPIDSWDKGDILDQVVHAPPRLLLEWQYPLGLLGHLLRESMLLLRATVGLAFGSLTAGAPIDPDALLPLWPPAGPLINLIQDGTDEHVADLEGGGDPGAQQVAERFHAVRKAALEVIARWDANADRVFDALLATLDTASHRVDPWIVGIADRRLRELANTNVPFRLGAYGWVDRPRPFTGTPGSPPPPGPTAAGLLHTPSYTQTLTAALLRDATVRQPGDDRWRLNINSAKVRAAARLAERVRLGVHPYEALGLEVERLVGEWNVVRALRKTFPLRDAHETRRSCDGARVLRAVLHGAEPLPAGLPAGLAAVLQPLEDVLDTYADLLVADGVHALVSGRGDLANAAMEAAAGLGAPPELRAVRTPRAAKTVRVSAWALLAPGGTTIDGAPALAADPAFAALLDAELGDPTEWTWEVADPAGPVEVSLADRGVHGADLLDLGSAAIEALVRGTLSGTARVRSTGGKERLAEAARLAELLGGGDENPPVPDPTSGRDDEGAAASDIRQAMIDDLAARLGGLRTRAMAVITQIDTVDPSDPAAVSAMLAELAPWWIASDDAGAQSLSALRAKLSARIAAAERAEQTVNGLRQAIRALVGHQRLPVLPSMDRSKLPGTKPFPADTGGRPSSDRIWLEIVAAVRPRLALLEARQLDATRAPWPAAVYTKDSSIDPWTSTGPVVVCYGPGLSAAGSRVAVAGLDAWIDSIPSRHHATSAAFGFNGPKARAPQAVLLAVPPDLAHRLTSDELVDVVLETRQLARARAARPDSSRGRRVATPSPIVPASGPMSFLQFWPPP